MEERTRAEYAQARREEWTQYRRAHFRAGLAPLAAPYRPEPGEQQLRLSYGQQWRVVAELTVYEQRAVLLLLLEAEQRRLDRDDVAIDRVIRALQRRMEE